MKMKRTLFGAAVAISALAAASTASASQPRDVPLAPSVQFVEGEILLDLRDDVSADDEANIAREYGITLTPNSAYSEAHDKFERVDVAPADVPGLVARLSKDPRVQHAEPMRIARALFVPDDPSYAKQWHMKQVGAESAWNASCGMGVTVAVVDTGVACFDTGPFSKGTDLSGTRCGGGYNFVDDKSEAYDDQGHGTHVAGTIAQTTNNGQGVAGLAHCARIMPVKVLNEYGWGTIADVAEGIRFAADNGAQVINLSLGSPGGDDVERDAIEYAASKGVIIVAAAGNEGEDDSVGFPASYPECIAVSATDSNDRLAPFSSRGPEVDIGAPGVKIIQQTVCDHGKNHCEVFAELNGTSMAAPHVAGAVAMIISLGVTEPNAVRAALLSSARPKDNPLHFGAGILDASAAVRSILLHHLFWRLSLLVGLGVLVALRIRKKDAASASFARSPGMIFGALLGGVGLLPMLPFLDVAGRAGSARWVVELLSRPFGEWDLVFSAGFHKWLPLANAVPVIVLAGLFFSSKRLRPVVGGFALGCCALLLQLAISAQVMMPFSPFGFRLFVLVNAAACFFIARFALVKKTAS